MIKSKFFKKHYLVSLVVIIVIVISSVTLLTKSASSQTSRLCTKDSCRVVSGSNLLVEAHGEAWMVNNSGTKDIFIPIKTATEWAQFRVHRPSSVSLTEPSCEYTCTGENYYCQDEDCFQGCGTIVYEGGPYDTIIIGSQCWMAENINVGTMITGDPTSDTTIEKWCYDHDPNKCASDGGLYDWNEAMRGSEVSGAQGICPTGWHIPTDAEWNTLENTVMSLSGGSGTCSLTYTGWQCSPAGTALKSNSGFNGLLTGYRYTSGSFNRRDSYAYYWSSTPSSLVNAGARLLNSGNSAVGRNAFSKANGFSVRCLKD